MSHFSNSVTNLKQMKNHYLSTFVKKTAIILLGLFFSTYSFGSNDLSQVTSKMKNFFTKTLIATYGDKPESELYNHFLTDYKKNNGNIALVINTNELKEINQLLFRDSIYILLLS